MSNFITAGLDIGNGYVKGVIGLPNYELEIDIPSCAYPVLNPSTVMPVETQEGIANIMNNVFECMDMSFDSNMITDGKRRWLGKRAISANKTGLESFNITANISKAKQDLSPVLALACIAGAALKDYWNVNQALPTDILEVHASLAVALPIEEYRDYRTGYKQAFKSNFHLVTIHNFVEPVRIKIVIDAVAVGAEGASAQYAIAEYGEPLYNELLRNASAHGAQLDGLQARHLSKIVNIMGIDIGEGTVNFPVFTNGDFNPDASRSINSGFGTVLENAILPLRNAGHQFKGGRKALADYLQAEPDQDDWFRSDYEDVFRIVTNESQILVNEIISQFTDIIGSGVRVAYVYGGGATPMRDILYPRLLSASKRFAGTKKDFPILYLGSQYSQILNREGLYIMAKTSAAMLADKAATAAQSVS